jgi:adenylate cyclase class IV
METTQENKANLESFTEFETKYRTEGDKVYQFKQIVETLPEKGSFIYVQGPDVYFTKGKQDMFARYRKAEHDKSGKAWLTFKRKPDGAKTNIKRKEYNWRVDSTPFSEIQEGIEAQGYRLNFQIYKMCHIYKFSDATLVFYTVRKNGKEDLDHFIEIEVDEKTISSYTEEQAYDVVRKYEEILAPIGITHRHRLTKSLFEMYVEDIGE